jgi:ubiquitin-activating enzyme E1
MSDAHPRVVVESDEVHGIDADRTSRVIPVLGAGNLRMLLEARVLVTGLGGAGLEVAKNLVLCGPGHVTLHDPENLTHADLSATFYASPADVGSNRAKVLAPRVRQLNPYVLVDVIEGALTDEVLSRFSCVVMCNASNEQELLRVARFCHSSRRRSGGGGVPGNESIIFIACDVRGVFSRIFCDFGPDHVVRDATGDELPPTIVSSVAKGPTTIVTVHENRAHGLSEGDFVQFSELVGMTQLNHDAPGGVPLCKVLSLRGRFGFEIDVNSTAFDEFIPGAGLVQRVKVETSLSFREMAAALTHPGDFIISDFAKLDNAAQLHFGFQGLAAFAAAHGDALPRPYCDEDAAAVVAAANERAAQAKVLGGFALDQVDDAIVRRLAYTARGVLNPMCAFVGGVVAQEVLKLTGKFTPIRQWFYFDSQECLMGTPADAAVLGSRYDGQIQVFGRAFQEKLAGVNTFLVGAGALGCELIKNFAMMGVGCSLDAAAAVAGSSGKCGGRVFLTDMDNIEKSNLSRQFLFRDGDIGKMKSPTAAAAATVMNPLLDVVVETTPVGSTTEDTFDDAFWQRLDFVVNALDNVKARLYMDGRCIMFQKPLLESGTLGTKANVQVIYPHMTESYGSSRDPQDNSIPVCTLKNFPHEIEHTIEWARDKFGGLFVNSFEDLQIYLADRAVFFDSIAKVDAVVTRLERLQAVSTLMRLAASLSYESLVVHARQLFDEFFRNNIMQLLFNFPETSTTSTGELFWSGPKRAPSPAKFDAADETHLSFVDSVARIFAEAFRLPADEIWPLSDSAGRARLVDVLTRFKTPEYVPRSGLRIKAGDADTTEEGASDDGERVEALLRELAEAQPPKVLSADASGKFVDPAAFEKDVDANGHIAFVTATSNLRAANYRIKPAAFHKTKLIAGRIIPAIATTTAMITGLVCLELYKIVGGLRVPAPSGGAAADPAFVTIERLRNSYVNLAIPSFVQSEPVPCKKNVTKPGTNVRFIPDGWTLWDGLLIEGDLTFQGLIDWFAREMNLTLSSLSIGTKLAYSPLFNRSHLARLPLKISEWTRDNVPEIGLKPTSKYLDLVTMVEDPDDDEVEIEIPDHVRLLFRN